jgi:hypothetical protein
MFIGKNPREQRHQYDTEIKNNLGRPEAVEQLVTISVQLASSNNFNDKTKQEFLLLTKTELEKLTKRVPTDARYLLLYGAFLNKFSMFGFACFSFL